jgi:hypothetical protein
MKILLKISTSDSMVIANVETGMAMNKRRFFFKKILLNVTIVKTNNKIKD